MLTAERFFSPVDPLVCSPRIVIGERLVTIRAAVELLFCVTQSMHFQVMRDCKTLATVGAGERLLPHVEQGDVRLKMGRLGKSPSACHTEEWSLTSVRHLMGL